MEMGSMMDSWTAGAADISPGIFRKHRFEAEKFAVKHMPIVRQADVGIIEFATEGSVGIVVDEPDRDFSDAQRRSRDLGPELERKGISDFIE